MGERTTAALLNWGVIWFCLSALAGVYAGYCVNHGIYDAAVWGGLASIQCAIKSAAAEIRAGK